eukprot:gnl/TRDRNA2_/TRDRNA2_175237_c0_seq1.p1 gnl/TRDRNA2_/TRDRNA2_175237_c0~~gnl/TRDRNA2_/TRDRNA2_175237_c0_seq1.p1  ORF type:complete len:242 (+),score=19.78 gnl/TRDRNA2_/TRDRNA2_175237_c0_seq1:112-837(+)
MQLPPVEDKCSWTVWSGIVLYAVCLFCYIYNIVSMMGTDNGNAQIHECQLDCERSMFPFGRPSWTCFENATYMGTTNTTHQILCHDVEKNEELQLAPCLVKCGVIESEEKTFGVGPGLLAGLALLGCWVGNCCCAMGYAEAFDCSGDSVPGKTCSHCLCTTSVVISVGVAVLFGILILIGLAGWKEFDSGFGVYVMMFALCTPYLTLGAACCAIFSRCLMPPSEHFGQEVSADEAELMGPY